MSISDILTFRTVFTFIENRNASFSGGTPNQNDACPCINCNIRVVLNNMPKYGINSNKLFNGKDFFFKGCWGGGGGGGGGGGWGGGADELLNFEEG